MQTARASTLCSVRSGWPFSSSRRVLQASLILRCRGSSRSGRARPFSSVQASDRCVAGSCFLPYSTPARFLFASTARIGIHSVRRNPTVLMALGCGWCGTRPLDRWQCQCDSGSKYGRTAGIDPGRRSIRQNQTIQGTRRTNEAASSVGSERLK